MYSAETGYMAFLVTCTLVLALAILLASTAVVHGENVKVENIKYRLVYDPMENRGILVLSTVINTGGSIAHVSIPVKVFEQGALNFINYSAMQNLSIVGANYDDEVGELELVVVGEGLLEAVFSASNLMEEQVLYYELLLDTTILSNVTGNATFEIYVVAPCNVSVSELYRIGYFNATVREGVNTTVVVLEGFGVAQLVFEIKLEEPSLTNQPVSWWQLYGMWVIFATVAATSVLIALILFYKRMSTKPIVEYSDVLRDPTLLRIMNVLSEAGEKGLSQSELARKTNLPKSSISRKVRRLKEAGFVDVKRAGRYNYIVLTPKGASILKELAKEKHGKQ